MASYVIFYKFLHNNTQNTQSKVHYSLLTMLSQQAYAASTVNIGAIDRQHGVWCRRAAACTLQAHLATIEGR